MKKGLLVCLLACLGAAGSKPWAFETGFECLTPRSGAPSIAFTQHDFTVTVKGHYGETISVADGVIYPDEPECISDEEPGLLMMFSERLAGQIMVRVIPLGEEKPEVFYLYPNYRTGYTSEYPMDGADGEYMYAGAIIGVHIEHAALDWVRIDWW